MLPRRQNTTPISARAGSSPYAPPKASGSPGRSQERDEKAQVNVVYFIHHQFHPAVELCAFENVSSSLNGCRRLFVCVIICRSNL